MQSSDLDPPPILGYHQVAALPADFSLAFKMLGILTPGGPRRFLRMSFSPPCVSALSRRRGLSPRPANQGLGGPSSRVSPCFALLCFALPCFVCFCMLLPFGSLTLWFFCFLFSFVFACWLACFLVCWFPGLLAGLLDCLLAWCFLAGSGKGSCETWQLLGRSLVVDSKPMWRGVTF